MFDTTIPFKSSRYLNIIEPLAWEFETVSAVVDMLGTSDPYHEAVTGKSRSTSPPHHRQTEYRRSLRKETRTQELHVLRYFVMQYVVCYYIIRLCYFTILSREEKRRCHLFLCNARNVQIVARGPSVKSGVFGRMYR